VAHVLLLALGLAACGQEDGCPAPEPHERFCILATPGAYDCDPVILSSCMEGQWSCRYGFGHPPAGEAFYEWAWRCEVIGCDAQVFRVEPGPDWQEEGGYTPPDPGPFTGEWELRADSDDVVPLGCERRPRQYVVVQSLAVHPQNPDVMYIGMQVEETGGSSFAAGVYKSVDGGRSWFTAWAGLGSAPCPWCKFGPAVRELYVDPADPRRVFASTYQRGLYWSRDGGAHWEASRYNDEMVWLQPGPVRTGRHGVLYHATSNAFFTWNSERPGFDVQGAVSQAREILVLLPDPVMAGRIWLGMGNTFRPGTGEGPVLLSDDAGRTWQDLGHELLGADGLGQNVVSLAVCAHDPAQMAAAVDRGGIYLSHDGGRTWSKPASAVPGERGYTVGYAPHPDRCVLFAQNIDSGGMHRTEDAGASWRRESVPPLTDLAFNPYLPEMAIGISPYPRYQAKPFELWVRR
jgi:photosystem II stability/assembly factor-like uncharacterized protein